MRYLTYDPAVVRHWAEERGATPAVSDDGLLMVALPDLEYTASTEISWEEFAGMFTAEKLAFIYDETPGSNFWVIGPEWEIHPFLEEAIPEHVP